MKKNVLHLIAIAIISIMVISCSTKKGSYTNVIPSDASVVLSIKPMAIWNKSGLNEQQYQTFIKEIQQTVVSKIDTSNAILEGLINDPTKSGIDFNENLYYYMPQVIGKSCYIVAKVNSYDNLYQTFENIPTGDTKVEFSKHNKVTVATLDSQFKCAFDDNTLVIIASQDKISADSLAMQLEGLDKGSINDNPAFEKMIKGAGDISVMVATDKVQKYMINEMSLPYLDNQMIDHIQEYKDMYLISNLCFEEGRLHLVTEYFTENKETRKQLDDYMAMMGELGDTFTSKFPSDLIAFIGMNINGEKLTETILKMYPELSKEINEDDNQKAIDAIKSINGDVVFGISDIYTTQSMALYAQVKDNSILNLLIENQRFLDLRLEKVSDNEYVYNMNPYKIAVGYKDNQIYATLGCSDNAEITNPLSVSQWASTIASSSAYTLINVESAMTKLEPLTKELSNYDNSTKQWMDLLSNISYVESYSNNSKNQYVINICNKDTKTNVLKIYAQYFAK